MEAEVGFEGFPREDFQKHNKRFADFKKKYTKISKKKRERFQLKP